MCGIAGYISYGKKIDGCRMIQTLVHRGPDNIGRYNENNNYYNIFLGHTRLSIIDLSEHGHQPMTTPDGQIYIIYNGEVYNFEELRRKYLRGYKFKSRTDSEVILYLYEKLGIDFVKELNGDFAITIYDKRNFKLYLIRDRLGVKPLYYSLVDNAFIFGSELKAILASAYPFSLSKENIQNYFVFKYVPGAGTLFRDIYRLKPGYYLEYEILNNKLLIKQYWQLKKHKDYEGLSYDESKEVLITLLNDAVENRLVSDVPVGTFLSGGIDSSAISYFLRDYSHISHYCAKKSEADLKKEGTSSDFYYANRLANDWNLKLYPIEIGSEILNFENLRRTIYYSDDLIADGSQIASYLITKKSRKTSKVMLSGMGGDELFLGYASHLITLLSLYLDLLPKYASNSIAHILRSLWQGRGLFKSYKRYLHKLGKYYSYPHYKYGIFGIVGDFENSRSVYNAAINSESSIEFLEEYFPEGSDPLDSLTHFEIENFLVKNLHYLDRMCMANSVEGRVPYLDHRLVEFAFSLRHNYKITNYGKSKRILKEAFKLKLPNYILKRKKAGFGLPLRSIFSSAKKTNQLLDRDFFTGFDGFSLKHIDGIIENHVLGKEDNYSIIYALISFQEWYKIFIEKTESCNETV